MTLSRLALALSLALVIMASAPAAALAQEQADTAAGISGEHDFNSYCASCHGSDGRGDGPKAFSLATRPPDLTTLTARYGAFPRERLARMIDGREPVAGHGEREMPVWGVWFKAESASELGAAAGDEAAVTRRLDSLTDYIAGLQAP